MFPAKAGTQILSHHLFVLGTSPSPNPLPQGGEGFSDLSPLPVGEGWVRALFFFRLPAKAFIRLATSRRCERVWIPAFAGKTVGWDGRGPISPLPVGEGWVRALLSSVFPAKAGIQILILSLDVALYRVIARCIAPKQPRGTSLLVRIRPLGCFASLAMTRGWDGG